MNQMFDKIQMILMMKTSISNNRLSRLKNKEEDYHKPVTVDCFRDNNYIEYIMNAIKMNMNKTLSIEKSN